MPATGKDADERLAAPAIGWLIRETLSMTTFFLIRHGSIDALGKSIVGRSPGVHLNALGKAEAARLAEKLVDCDVTAMDRPLKAAVCCPLRRHNESR